MLTEEDIALMPGGWSPGDTMGTASYYQTVKQVRVQASLDYQTGDAGEENSFVKRVTLVYPGQDLYGRMEREDLAVVRLPAVLVEERGIRQQIRISKTIEKISYNNTSLMLMHMKTGGPEIMTRRKQWTISVSRFI